MHRDHSYLWKIEKGTASLSYELAAKLDEVLKSGSALIRTAAAANGRLRPAQLPAAPGHVVGRETELSMLAEGARVRPLGTPSVVAIDGPAGAGKTTLALRWAHQIKDRYVDGHLYADLGGFGPADEAVSAAVILERFLIALGANAVPDDAADRTALYRSLLADRHVLIVLDNVRDLTDVDRLMPASARCGLVVTSRRTLSSLVTRVDATRVTVRWLTEADSVVVVSNIIGVRRAAAESDAVATLTRLCGHLPLALCVAAEEIATYPHRPISDMVNELLEEKPRFCSSKIADLRAVFSWSYRELGTDEARLFRLLGLHPGPHLSVTAAAALAGINLARARRLLYQLASLHLIDIESDYVIRRHELLRAYTENLVRTKENDEHRAAAIRRLTTWYVNTALAASVHTTHAPEPMNSPTALDGVEPLVFASDQDAQAWYEAEVDNIGPITGLVLEFGQPGDAEQLVASLRELERLNGNRANADAGHDETAGPN